MNSRIVAQHKPYAWLAAIMVVMLAAASPSAWARGHASPTRVTVVSKLSFQGNSATDMVLHQADGKSYLYVRLAGNGQVAVVDVTRPETPSTVSSLRSSSIGSVSSLVVGKDVALVTGKTQASDSASSDTALLTVWDISQAGAPRVVQEFPGVRKIIEDERGYIYILDREALWVVKDKADQPASQQDISLMGIFG